MLKVRLTPLCLLALHPTFAADYTIDVTPVSGGAAPQQQWSGDKTQVYEVSATTNYNVTNTNAQAMTNYGVWGHDEGPSTSVSDGKIFWFWGDTVTGRKQMEPNGSTTRLRPSARTAPAGRQAIAWE